MSSLKHTSPTTKCVEGSKANECVRDVTAKPVSTGRIVKDLDGLSVTTHA